MIPGMAELVAAVQGNCNIADARHARETGLCSYLLDMREFYRWEHDVPYGTAPPREEVGRWIAGREALWDEIVDDDFAELSIGGRTLNPLDAPAINRALDGSGLVYGGGIGRFGKPHFFLARLAREEARAGARLLVCGREYARDITAMPAALQGDTIVVRREALRQWLWEKAEGWSVKRQPGALREALAAHGFDSDPTAAIERMSDVETETLVLHEEGEFLAGRQLDGWGTMMAGLTRKRPEILARAVRDNLADCLVTLPALLARDADGAGWASLHFWMANFEGMRRELFPALAAAYTEITGGTITARASASSWSYGAGTSGDTALLASVVETGQAHWLKVARHLLTLNEAAMEQLSHESAAIVL